MIILYKLLMFSFVRSLFQAADRSILQASNKCSIFHSCSFLLRNNEIVYGNSPENCKLATSTSLSNNNAGMHSTRWHSKSFHTSQFVNGWLSQKIFLNTSSPNLTSFGDMGSKHVQRYVMVLDFGSINEWCCYSSTQQLNTDTLQHQS